MNYQELVEKRKKCYDCKELTGNFVNQSEICGGEFDKNEIGNFSTWANALDADVIIVAQDYSNQKTFKDDKGDIQRESEKLHENSSPSEYSTVTNYYLRELTKELGLDIGLPTQTSKQRIFLTNAVLCLKGGKMNAPIRKKVYKNCGIEFLKPLIDIINPKAIITLGATATQATVLAYQDKIVDNEKIGRELFSKIFKRNSIKIEGSEITIFPVYHPGRFGQINRKRVIDTDKSGFDLQKEDWRKIRGLIK